MDIRKIIQNLLGIEDKDMPEGENLEGFSDEQIEQARSLSSDAFTAAKEARDLGAAREATQTVEALATEQTVRADAANFDTEIAELEGRVSATNDPDPEGDPTPDPEPDPEPEPVVEPEVTPEPVTVVEPPKVEAVKPVAAQPAAEAPKEKVAAASVTPIAVKAPPVVPAPSAAPATSPKAKVTILAAGDVKGHSAGTEMQPSDLAEPWVAKMEAATTGRIKDRLNVGSLTVEYPSDRFLSDRDTADINMEKVAAVQALAQEQARQHIAELLSTSSGDYGKLSVLTAEGGLCAPVNVRYDIFGVGTDKRPLRDGLSRFGATRGGIQFNEPPVLTSVAGSSAVFTEAQDAAGTDYPKDCIRVDCGELITVKISAVTLCMEVGNFQRLTYPENFAEWWRLGKVAHARLAEETLWAGIVALGAGSHGTLTSASMTGVGTTRQFLAALARATQQYRDRHRTGDELVLRTLIPSWLVTMMQEDLTNQAPGDATIALAKSAITRYLAAFNVVAAFVLDGQVSSDTGTYAQADGALNGWPSSVTVAIYPEGALLFLDRGTLDFGTEIRDFDQIRNNDSGAFMETLENVAHVGPELEILTINSLCNSGFSGAPNPDFAPCEGGLGY